MEGILQPCCAHFFHGQFHRQLDTPIEDVVCHELLIHFVPL